MKPVETKGTKWSLNIIKLEFLFSFFLVLGHAVETFGVCMIHGSLAVSLPDGGTQLGFVAANAFRSSVPRLPIASVPAPVRVGVRISGSLDGTGIQSLISIIQTGWAFARAPDRLVVAVAVAVAACRCKGAFILGRGRTCTGSEIKLLKLLSTVDLIVAAII